MSAEVDTSLPAEEQLRQLGRQAYHYIDAAKKHDTKSANLWLSAGLTLIECKKRVPHGQWIAWLEQTHKISRQTAHKAMQIAASGDPVEALKEHREKDAARKQEERRSRSEEGPTECPGRPGHLNASVPLLHKRPRRAPVSMEHAKAHKAIDALSPEQVRAVLKYIQELT